MKYKFSLSIYQIYQIYQFKKKKKKKEKIPSVLFSGLCMIDNTGPSCTLHIHSINMTKKSHTNLSSTS